MSNYSKLEGGFLILLFDDNETDKRLSLKIIRHGKCHDSGYQNDFTIFFFFTSIVAVFVFSYIILI